MTEIVRLTTSRYSNCEVWAPREALAQYLMKEETQEKEKKKRFSGKGMNDEEKKGRDQHSN